MSFEVIVKQNKMPSLYRELQREMNRALLEVGERIRAEAYDNTHVITGEMRDSLSVEVDEDGAVHVGYGVPYAVQEELGNAYRPPHPALGPAFDAHVGDVPEAANRALQRAIGGL